ncbi:MAG: hypothetical protein ACO3JL_07230 [Myxococcota bacterium]
MKRASPFRGFLFALLLLSGCQEARLGADLCQGLERALEEECGLSVSACEDALFAQEGFESEHAYTAYRIDVQDGRCWLLADDIGDGVAWPTSEVEAMEFDLGDVGAVDDPA